MLSCNAISNTDTGNMKAIYIGKWSCITNGVDFQGTTQRYIPEDITS
jgi:hypothetical protein